MNSTDWHRYHEAYEGRPEGAPLMTTDIKALAERLEYPRVWVRHEGLALVADEAPHEAASALRSLEARAIAAERENEKLRRLVRVGIEFVEQTSLAAVVREGQHYNRDEWCSRARATLSGGNNAEPA